MTVSDTHIRRLVSSLPEIYQPIYSFPEYDHVSSRRSEDRLSPIIQAVQDYPTRPIRLLDIGCAQGYFDFKLDELGVQVTAVDSLRENIALCRALNEKAGRRVVFQEAHLDLEYALRIPDDHYDFVLILNLLHHIWHNHDAAYVSRLLRTLADKARVVIMELALKEEPMYWAEKLPDSPAAFVRDFAFTREIAESSTHLSAVCRPMFLASDRFAYINRKYYSFDRHLLSSHEFEQDAHLSTRRYYFGKNILIKSFDIQQNNADLNRSEIENEAALLREHESLAFLPKLLEAEIGSSHAMLVRDLLPGERLSHYIDRHTAYEPDRIISDILDILVELERHGLYHHDLRIWNVLVDEHGHARLIDFGAVDKHKNDSVFDEFLTFCHDTLYGVKPVFAALAWPRRSPSLYKGRYRTLARHINRCEDGQLSFSGVREILESDADALSDTASDNDPYERLYARLEASANERFQRLYVENQHRTREIQALTELLGDVDRKLLLSIRNLTIRRQMMAVLRKLARIAGFGRR